MIDSAEERQIMKEHIMNLTPVPFKKIKDGQKTIELRLYDDKRKDISIGDTIVFVNADNKNDTVSVIVKNLFVFKTFDELYKNLPLLKCGYTEDSLHKASPDDMEKYYSREKQSQYGVVGIEIMLK